MSKCSVGKYSISSHFPIVIAWRLSKIRAKYFHLRINFPWRPILTNDISANFPTERTAQIMWDQWHGRFNVGTNNCFKMSIQTKMKQDHLMMNVAPDQTIILSLQIFLDYKSLSSIDKKILMIPPSPPPPHLPLFHLFLSFCPFVFLSFCPSVLLSFCPSVFLSFCFLFGHLSS